MPNRNLKFQTIIPIIIAITPHSSSPIQIPRYPSQITISNSYPNLNSKSQSNLQILIPNTEP